MNNNNNQNEINPKDMLNKAIDFGKKQINDPQNQKLLTTVVVLGMFKLLGNLTKPRR